MDKFVYDLTHHLTYRIARLQARLNAQATEILKQNTDISLSEWRILAILIDPEIASQKDMLKAMGLDKGQVSRTIKRLEAKNYIISEHDDADNRKRQISLSDSGRELVVQILPLMIKRQAYLKSPFNEDELNSLYEFITKLEHKAGPVPGLKE